MSQTSLYLRIHCPFFPLLAFFLSVHLRAVKEQDREMKSGTPWDMKSCKECAAEFPFPCPSVDAGVTQQTEVQGFCPTLNWGCHSPCWHPLCFLPGISAQLATRAGQIPPWGSSIKVNDGTPGMNLAHWPELESTTSPAGSSEAAGRIPGTGSSAGSCGRHLRVGDSINPGLSKPDL